MRWLIRIHDSGAQVLRCLMKALGPTSPFPLIGRVVGLPDVRGELLAQLLEYRQRAGKKSFRPLVLVLPLTAGQTPGLTLPELRERLDGLTEAEEGLRAELADAPRGNVLLPLVLRSVEISPQPLQVDLQEGEPVELAVACCQPLAEIVSAGRIEVRNLQENHLASFLSKLLQVRDFR